jgi:hypothetical protein
MVVTLSVVTVALDRTGPEEVEDEPATGAKVEPFKRAWSSVPTPEGEPLPPPPHPEPVQVPLMVMFVTVMLDTVPVETLKAELG